MRRLYHWKEETVDLKASTLVIRSCLAKARVSKWAEKESTNSSIKTAKRFLTEKELVATYRKCSRSQGSLRLKTESGGFRTCKSQGQESAARVSLKKAREKSQLWSNRSVEALKWSFLKQTFLNGKMKRKRKRVWITMIKATIRTHTQIMTMNR
jgi:hypothetical protein